MLGSGIEFGVGALLLGILDGVSWCVMDELPWTMERFDSSEAASEAFRSQGWTDGLPIVPPTVERVESLLAETAIPYESILGEVVGRGLRITAWQAATTAVMAGCRRDYFPVVLASWAAILDSRFNLNAAITSSGGPGLTAVVSGAVGLEIGMNSGGNVLGTGNRANATIGRAIRLGIVCCLRSGPIDLDAASFGHAGKFSTHFLETDPAPPWRTLRERLGYAEDTSTVTVVPTEAPRQVSQRLSSDPEDVLRAVASCMRDPSQHGTGRGTYYVILLGPEHSRLLRASGWTQTSIQEYLSHDSRISVSELARGGQKLEQGGSYDMQPDSMGMLTAARPEHILVVSAGGPGAGWSAVLPCWTGTKTVHPVSKPIHEQPGDPGEISPGLPSILDFA